MLEESLLENALKLKHLPYLLGKKVQPVKYGYEVQTFLVDGKPVKFAQWLHPGNTVIPIRDAMVGELTGFLRPGDVAIDIGAYTGDLTVPMALAVGKMGTVVAFEPNQYVFEVLEANAELNAERTNILSLNFAATEEDGEFEFEYSDPGYCNGGRHDGVNSLLHGHVFPLQVKGRNAARLLERDFAELLPRLRYIKVDAEGYDLKVLHSLEKLLRQYKPYLTVEVFRWLPKESRSELFSFLTALNYEIFRVREGAYFTGEQKISKEEMNNWPHFDLFCVPKT